MMRLLHITACIALILICLIVDVGAVEPPGGVLNTNEKPRIIVSTDIGGSDPDDFQSMVHYLVYSDDFDTEGLISSPPNAGRKADIEAVIDEYERDYQYLWTWSTEYPTPDSLRAIVKQGAIDVQPDSSPSTNVSAGAQHIVNCAKSDDSRPLYILVWGSITDVAQAVHKDPSIKNKIRVYAIGSWNTSMDPKAMDYLVDNHADDPNDPLWIVENDATFRGMFECTESGGEYGNWDWPRANVDNHGYLGEFFVDKKTIIKMGDTPSVLYMLTGDPGVPTAAHWGGRFTHDSTVGDSYWTDSSSGTDECAGRAGAMTVHKWREAFLDDWESRMDRAKGKNPNIPKIMCLGNSITQGSKDHQSYRYKLWKTLIDRGLAFDFTGSLSGNYIRDPAFPDYKGLTFDKDHEGHWGWRTDEILNGRSGEGKLSEWLVETSPDAALIHLGTNDVFQGESNESTANELRDVISTLRGRNPEIVVFLSKLIPTNVDAAKAEGVEELNTRIPNIANDMDSDQSPVILVDQFTGFSATDDTYDRIHPNESGETKMALQWADAVSAYYNGTIPPPENHAPIADAGPDIAVVDEDGDGGETVQINGEDSYDPDGDPLSYEWSENGVIISRESSPALTMEVGAHALVLKVTDESGESDEDAVAVSVEAKDIQAPSVPQDLHASGKTFSSVSLAWSASSDDTGVDHYEVFRDGALAGTSETTVFTDDGLTAGATFNYRVLAVDLAGNRSEKSALLTVETDSSPAGFREENGLVTMEAEHYVLSNANGDGAVWGKDTSETGYVGEGYMTTPDAGSANATWEEAAELVYPVVIGAPGSYTVWVRVSQADTAGNSALVGLDDVQLGGVLDNSDGSDGWRWHAHDARAELTAGRHRFQLRRREDGYRVDRILLSLDPNYAPGGEGPEESKTVEEPENEPPIAEAGSDQIIDDVDGDGAESVTLDGTGSTDPEGDALTYAWSEAGKVIATSEAPTLDLDVGVHSISLSVSDGEWSDEDGVSITVNEMTDSEAPSVPTDVRVAEATHFSLSLKWTASEDNVGVARYQVFCDSHLIGEPDVPEFAHENLEPAATYNYQIAAVDSSGNVSEKSVKLTAKTTAPTTVDLGDVVNVLQILTGVPVEITEVAEQFRDQENKASLKEAIYLMQCVAGMRWPECQ